MLHVLNDKRLILFILWYSIFPYTIQAWNTDELEVFDAVDEIKLNFYTLLNVSRNADATAIRKSFRKLSLVIHPDHNPSPAADQEFRHLVLAYDILKHQEKRQYYDSILENGLPDWRQAVYYYRRVRKMGLQEMFLILTVIVSIGQYLVAWASYLERKFTMKEIMKVKDKRSAKKLNKKNKVENSYPDDFIDSVILRPSVRNTLPFQICYLLKELVVYVFKLSVRKVKEFWNKEPAVKETVRPRPENLPTRSSEKPKKVNFVPELVQRRQDSQTNSPYMKITEPLAESSPVISGGLWTDDDILMLIKLVKKHPAGESERWVKIADAMNRTVGEVTHMANKIKDNDFRIPPETEEQHIEEEPRKVKTKGGKLGVKIVESEDGTDKGSVWTQIQQKALEAALNKYSKKTVGDRWEKIASCVPDKSKDECILRYKKIAAVIRQRKSEINDEEESNENQDEKKDNGEITKENGLEQTE